VSTRLRKITVIYQSSCH